MERQYQAFRYLIEVCYKANPENSVLLILHIYTANNLEIERDSIRTSKDLRKYFEKLKCQLEKDISKYLNIQRSLKEKNEELINGLVEARLLPKNPGDRFDASKY